MIHSPQNITKIIKSARIKIILQHGLYRLFKKHVYFGYKKRKIGYKIWLFEKLVTKFGNFGNNCHR